MAAPIIISLSGGGKTASAVAFPKNTSGNSKTLPKPFGSNSSPPSCNESRSHCHRSVMTAPTSTPSSTLSIFKANWPNGARTSKGGPIFGKSAMRCSARPMNTCHCFTTFMKATATMQNSFRRCWRSFSVGSKSGLVPRGRRLNRRSSSTKEITPPTTSPCWTLWTCSMWARSNWMNISIWQPFPTTMPAGSPPRSAVEEECTAGAPTREKLRDTYLGKTLLITGHQEWSDVQVFRAYRSQFVIEEIFHEMKDRHIGAWWPLHHSTDSKIQVHGLYCTIAVLLRALLWRRARQAGLRLSMSGLLKSLSRIRQVINIYPSKSASKTGAEQVLLNNRYETQGKHNEKFCNHLQY